MNELRQQFSLPALLKFAGVARSTFFYRLKADQAVDRYSDLREKVKTIYHLHKGRYGYRRITAAIRNMGEIINHKTVQRLMGECGLKSIVRRKKYNSFKGDVGSAAPNLLDRDFDADVPGQKLVTDVTEFKVGGEKLYLSPVLDLCNREIVGYEMATRPVFELVSESVRNSIANLSAGSTPMLHSDQGWHYRMAEFKKMLSDGNIVQSMSRKANCHDNAAMESFFAVMKTEMFHVTKFKSIEDLKVAIQEYIKYYNHDRIKQKLGWLSPVQFRTRHQSVHC